MPAQSIWMIRISLGYFFITSLIGSLLLIHKAVEIHPAIWALLPVHYEMAIWGWMVQFVIGTAYWIFPRYLNASPRGSVKSAWLVVAALNSGLLLIIGETLIQFHQNLKIGGRLLIILSIVTFIIIIWHRVVSYRQHES